MSWDRAALPFRRFDSAGRPTPNLLAASVTDIPSGMTCCRMKRPTSVERLPDCAMEIIVLCCATHVNACATSAAGNVIDADLHAGRHVR